MKAEELEKALNSLIEQAEEHGGHVYIVDREQNAFALKLTRAVKINFYGGYNEREAD